jgi:hypothetical protein
MSDLICNPDKLLVIFRSKSFEGKTTKVLPYYKTKFDIEKLSDSILQKIKSPKVTINKKKLDLPPLNNLFPKTLDVHEKNENHSLRPVLL